MLYRNRVKKNLKQMQKLEKCVRNVNKNNMMEIFVIYEDLLTKFIKSCYKILLQEYRVIEEIFTRYFIKTYIFS